jgi:hypothetical protein
VKNENFAIRLLLTGNNMKTDRRSTKNWIDLDGSLQDIRVSDNYNVSQW